MGQRILHNQLEKEPVNSHYILIDECEVWMRHG
jgi:hypothetical protein